LTNEERLIKVYQEAQQTLINLIAYKEARGSVTWYQETLLKQVRQVLMELNAYSATWAMEAINEAYGMGAQEAFTALQSMGVSVNTPETFARLNARVIALLMANTQSMLFSGVSFVGRQIEDSVRQAGLEAAQQKFATGSTVREMKKALVKKLVDQGLNGIRDKRGRMISLDAYAATVARSTTREATNTGTMNQLTNNGYDLVKMSSHATTCAICAVYQGRVYSISGKSSDFPSLSIAYSGGYANIHPNCRHVIAPYVPALADDFNSDLAYSNRSFDMETRSKTAIERYNKDQADKRRLRLDRQQWERYKLALGEDAPKTLSGFRRMKEANSQRWVDLQSDYREFSKQ
jgi:hypothetical protein